jgi:hypothetical protein
MMTQTQAERVMKALTDVYPRHGLEGDGLNRYVDTLIDSGAEFDRAHEIAMRWPKTHDFFPSIAELMAVVATRKYVTADPDDTSVHPDVMRRMTALWREKMAEVDKRRTGRGPDGHWHGNPDEPCPVCGGRVGIKALR